MAETVLEGDEMAEATAHRRHGMLGLSVGRRSVVFVMDRDQISPVGRAGEESRALDEHGIVDDDAAVEGIEGGGG